MILSKNLDRYICKQEVDFNDQRAEKNYYFDQQNTRSSNSDKLWFIGTNVILGFIFLTIIL